MFEQVRKHSHRLLMTLFLFTPWSAWTSPAELKHGRYIGWIVLRNHNQRLAVVSDFFLESPEDLTKFPKLKSIMKLSLGGYNTHEYVTETFEDLHYDFDNGVLNFDEPDKDLAISSEIRKVGSKTKIIGEVFVRSSMISGSLELTLEDDEPGDSEPGDDEPGDDGDLFRTRENQTAPFVPLLNGQYEGICDEKMALFQIQTVRGLKTRWQDTEETSGLGRHYGIVGRIALKDEPLCGKLEPGQWCTFFDYSAGSYNFYTGKLNFHGPRAADGCDVLQGLIQCRIRVQGAFKSCSFKKKDMLIKDARFFARKYHVLATEDQKGDLPEPNPPLNSTLSANLKGIYLGYLHNESNDVYQVVRLHVTPYSSTNSPHNPNQMMVASTVAVHFERGGQGPFFSQTYDSRSFYLRPGFTLMGNRSDSYINIQDWKRGYIRGVWYSHAFGRVGTVELVKADLPSIDRNATILNSFSGEFQGRVNSSGPQEYMRWVKFIFPANPNDLAGNIINFTGSYQSIVGITGVKDIERGAFDPYTGTLGWILSNGEEASTFSNGKIGDDHNALLYWPSTPKVFGAITNDYVFQKYKRQ